MTEELTADQKRIIELEARLAKIEKIEAEQQENAAGHPAPLDDRAKLIKEVNDAYGDYSAYKPA
jgi:hypothetical protein